MKISTTTKQLAMKSIRKRLDPQTQREAAILLTAMAERQKRNAALMRIIAKKFWTLPAEGLNSGGSPIGECIKKSYDYAKELQGYMEHFK